jgi:two-component system sensor histidine kinase RegB
VKTASELRQVVAWLPGVRLVACVTLWVVLAAVALLPQLDLSLRRIWMLVAAAAISRTALLAAERWRPSFAGLLAGASLTVDVVLLTGLLDITGGPFNPFVVIYAALVWRAAATLSVGWLVVVGATAAVTLGWLVLDHVQNYGAEHHRLADLPTHLFTMWVAAAATAELIAHYAAITIAAIAERQRQVDEARARAMRSEHLASLMTLAAGAAHELSTPLGTIAVAARELERAAAHQSHVLPLVDDARLIRREVDKCQNILEQMSGRAGTDVQPFLSVVTPPELVRIAAARLTEPERRLLDISVDADAAQVPSSAEAVQAVASLLKNAFDASEAASPVALRISRRASMLRVEVHDRGCGMSDEVMRRAGEPFFTTKEPGRGLGLGLFLARTFAERAGGGLWFERGAGTIAILEIPAESEGAIA